MHHSREKQGNAFASQALYGREKDIRADVISRLTSGALV
ncbi:hypothetical protein BREVUG8_100640 [Brevundimonas sp. G8]|nr:hypothetical protein BREVUG8_100640 [Brevundimonas sp. G8]